jgi:hypothetical protein
MVLRHCGEREPVELLERQAIKFVMVNDPTRARIDCLASFAALHDIEGGEAPDREERMRRFERNRLAFETIAASKYDEGLAEPNGTVIVKTEDVRRPEFR